MAFMCDPARVIGATDPNQNDARFEKLPPALGPVMDKLYKTDSAIVAGEPSLTAMKAMDLPPTVKIYCISRSENFEPPPELPNLIQVTDADKLGLEYEENKDELLVIGGLTVFKLLLPFANQLDVAETSDNVPGDLVFDDWDNGDFAPTQIEHWQGGRTLHLQRVQSRKK